jgi:hypothetical protein
LFILPPPSSTDPVSAAIAQGLWVVFSV